MLKLIALDKNDLDVISAHIQDSIVQIGDIDWIPDENRFLIALNRFLWENEEQPKQQNKCHERRFSVLHFNRVQAVKSLGIKQSEKEGFLSLLSVEFEEPKPENCLVVFKFAAGATIQLQVECIEAQFTDIGDSWATECKPKHQIEV